MTGATQTFLIQGVKSQLAGLDQNDHGARMAVPAGVAARSDHDVLHYSVARVRHVQHDLPTVLVDLEHRAAAQCPQVLANTVITGWKACLIVQKALNGGGAGRGGTSQKFGH